MFDNYKEFGEIISKKCDVVLTPTLLLLMLYFEEDINLEDIDVIKLPESKEKQQDLNWVDKLMKNISSKYCGEFVLRHILSELTYNVHEHAFDENSETNAYIAFKEFSKEELLEICIVDFGLSIPGRFDVSYVDYIDDCNAIEKAINNFSTVSTNPYERGNGLWTTIRFIIEGNGGEILIVSRKGLLHITKDSYKYQLLDDEKIFNGTLISIRLNKYEVQHVYDLIELHRHNFYKYGG